MWVLSNCAHQLSPEAMRAGELLQSVAPKGPTCHWAGHWPYEAQQPAEQAVQTHSWWGETQAEGELEKPVQTFQWQK